MRRQQLPVTPSFSLDGKKALVTGASSGIGQACAVALASAGADVVVAARRLDKLTVLVEQLQQQGCSATAIALDVSDVDNISRILAAQGSFDILVNSAGIARHGKALDTKLEDFQHVMDTNLRGAYFLTREVARGLVQAGKPGSLINISSQMAFVGGQERALYCASKHAVEGFTKAMAIEFGSHNIRVNTICPTFIRTALTQSTFDQPKKMAWLQEKILLGRVGEVEDIMGPVVFLASDASALMTGSALLVDGGWTAE